MTTETEKIHRCVHGRIIDSLNIRCTIGAGRKGWKRNGIPDKCPWIWSVKDCPEHKINKKYRS